MIVGILAHLLTAQHQHGPFFGIFSAHFKYIFNPFTSYIKPTYILVLAHFSILSFSQLLQPIQHTATINKFITILSSNICILTSGNARPCTRSEGILIIIVGEDVKGTIMDVYILFIAGSKIRLIYSEHHRHQSSYIEQST